MNPDKMQEILRERLTDLKASLSISNCTWNAWELEFIEDMTDKLEYDRIKVPPKQFEKITDLWEKI